MAQNIGDTHDTLVQGNEDNDALLQGMSLGDLHDFALVLEDNPSANEEQTKLLSDTYLFIFSKTNETAYLHKAMGKANEVVAAVVDHPERAVRLKSMEDRFVSIPASLPIAARLGLVEIVKLLLGKGVEVDAEDEEGRTALDRGAENGHEAVVNMLLENGASVNAKHNGNDAPLHQAAGHGHEAVVRLLLENGADINEEDRDGDTALHSAAYHGYEAVARLLLEKGANIKANCTRTALQWAAQRGHDAVVRLLLEKGAPADIVDDTDKALGNVAKGRLLEDIEHAQQIMFHKHSIESWAQNLRFVVSAANSEGSNYDFELIEPDTEEAKSEPYIAVSYCWGRNISEETPLRILVPSRSYIGTKEIRNVRARPDILQRSLSFAAAKGIRKVWIDQECIHQDDEKDKEKAIQSMHLVYRHAATTLIVMDCHIQTLEEVYALPNIKEFGVHHELRGRIVRDKWFTRSWTTQEFASSLCENLTYLVGWKAGVDVSGNAWELVATTFNESGRQPQQNVRRAWELNHSQIYDIAHMCPDYPLASFTLGGGNTLFGNLGSDIIFTLIDKNIEDMYWWKYGLNFTVRSSTPMKEDETRDVPEVCRTPSYYQKLNMLMHAAFTILTRKGAMLVSDKLAILGNLTDYPIRIDSNRATKEELSFSACIIAIALYNGDLTPLFSPRSLPAAFSPSRNAETCIRPLASWLPFNTVPVHTLLSMASAHTRFRSRLMNGNKCLVLSQKAIVKGLLWDIEPFRELDGLSGNIRKQQQSDKANNNGKESAQSFLQLLVRRLLTLGRRDILELIIAAVMRRQLTSPNEVFRSVYELEEWFHGERFWPAHIAEETFLKRTTTTGIGISWGKENRDVNEYLTYTDSEGVGIALGRLDSPIGPRVEGGGKPCLFRYSPIMQRIYDAISNGLPLALGKCSIGEETLISIFTFDPAKHQTVFTPLCELEYEFGKNPWIHLHPKDSFWCVRICEDKVSSADMQKAIEELGRIRDKCGAQEHYVSNQILEVEDPTANEEIYAIWSPRLSRIGMVIEDPEGKSWKRVPLGRGIESISEWLFSS